MIDCGEKECYSCSKDYCVNACYNFSCSMRTPISDASDNGCENAHNCMGFLSRKTYLKRKSSTTKS